MASIERCLYGLIGLAYVASSIAAEPVVLHTHVVLDQAQDRIFDRYSQSIRGVETYSDPTSSRQMELPNGYRHAWRNGTDYVLSDDAGLNPYNIGEGTWTEIHPAR